MNTVKVTFSSTYTPGYDTLYTYQTEETFEPGQIGFVQTADGAKKVRVIEVDDVFDTYAEERFGPLAVISTALELDEQEHQKKVEEARRSVL